MGSLRTLTSTDGSTVVERLETLDAAAHRLSYILLTDTPFGDCLTTLAVRDLGPNQAGLAWSATFQSDGLPESEAVDLLEGALAANCLALKQFMEAGRITAGKVDQFSSGAAQGYRHMMKVLTGNAPRHEAHTHHTCQPTLPA